MINMQNFGQVTGRLARDPNIIINRDGSRRVFLTIVAEDGYTDRNGNRGSQFVPCEAYIPASRGDGVYSLLESGAAVSVAYSVRNNNYRMASGEMHYGIILQIERIHLMETKEAAELRRARREAAADNKSVSGGRKRKSAA